jgi:hypothetical protein
MKVTQKAKTSSGRSNNASKGVDENVWKVHAVTKQQRKCDNPPRKIPYYLLRPIHFGH